MIDDLNSKDDDEEGTEKNEDFARIIYTCTLDSDSQIYCSSI